jgi:adenine-specific DNA-methyltransferase
MSENRRKLQTLRELFQFDAADLDFGIYAVMNHKRAEVARFIEHDILDVIEPEFKRLMFEGVR